ncbi:unnamed protein product [Coccothraustes coccothraustes]
MQALRKGEDAYLELSGAKGQLREVFSKSRALESTGTGTMLSAPTSRRRISGALRSEAPVPGGFQQKPRFGEHRHRHHAQCVKKPRLRFHQPESAEAAET